MTEKDNLLTFKRLQDDQGFYNNVFKKSEKASSVILYILSFSKTDSEKSLIEINLEKKSLKLHEVSLQCLSCHQSATTELLSLKLALLELQSTLELAVAARKVAPDLSVPVMEQIDGILRYLVNHHLTDGREALDLDITDIEPIQNKPVANVRAPRTTTAANQPRRASRVRVPAGDISSDAYMVYSQLTDRAERIKTVLEAKPQATVKDISEIVTDVSEKTIQRELNSLIEKGQVMREGERRWSRYSVVKD